MKKDSYSIIFNEVKMEDNLSVYIPVDILKGIVNENGEFISKNNKYVFSHIINNPKEYGYAYNNIIDNLLKKYFYLPFQLRKKMVLKHMQNYNYVFGFDKKSYKPVIIIQDLYSDNLSVLSDNYIDKYINLSFSEVKHIFNIKDAYSYITNKVNSNDENIKRILTILWKRSNNSLTENEKNILIDGNDIESKIKIFKYLEEASGIQVTLTSITEKKNDEIVQKEIEELLKEILIKSEGNYNKAINSVLLIDDLDNIKLDESNDYQSVISAQNALIELLKGKTYVINYNNQKVMFDTSKLVIISLCDFSKYKVYNKIGFSIDDKTTVVSIKNNILANGILYDLAELFQTTMEIKNNNTKRNDIEENKLIKELMDLLNKYGIELEISDETHNLLLNSKSNSRENINKMLSLALFDIAVDPQKYEKLIVSAEAIEDNKKYTLVRKK